MGGGQALDPLAQRRPGDRPGVDRIGLASRSRSPRRSRRSGSARRAPPAPPRPTRKRSKGPETCRQSSIAQTRSAPRARPQSRIWRKAGLARRRGQLAHELAACRPDRRHGVGVLVGVRSDYDHSHRPFRWSVQWADRWLTRLTRGGATLLLGQAGGPRAAASDATEEGQAPGVDALSWSQLAADPENQPSRSDVAADHGSEG